MEDRQIVDLYWARNEAALSESDKKYGKQLSSVSYTLVSSREDAEECVNDTYLAAWNRMPTDRPEFLGAFLTRIVRNISISRFRQNHRAKRDGGTPLILDELAECIPDGSSVEAQYENGRLAGLLNHFVTTLDEEKRAVFVRRYFWSQEVRQISDETGIGLSNVKTMLFRMRGMLKTMLEREGLL